jgi:hypothetical protein
MDDYQELYRQAFETLGRRLKPEDEVPEETILAAERRLGLRMPKALADYYRSAGMADDYNSIFDRLLPPGELAVESGRLLFMEENQAVVLWGTDAGVEPTDDPPAYQTTNAEALLWENVNDRCSVFLLVMLHWAGAFAGAMPNASTAAVDEKLLETLDRTWAFVGEVNGLRAYNRPGEVVCFLKWEDEWRIFAGSTSEEGMKAIAADLGVTWESPFC